MKRFFASREHYETEPGTWHPRVAETLVDHVAPRRAAHVLDVACGTGLAARSVADRIGTQGHVDAVDLSAAMLARAREHLTAEKRENIALREADANTLELHAAAYDVILCCEALATLRDHPHLFRAWFRALKPGGTLGFTAYSADSGSSKLFRRALEAVTKTPAPPTVFDVPGGAEACRTMLSGAGFEDIAIKTESETHLTDPDLTPISHDFLRLLFRGHPDIERLSADDVHTVGKAFRDAARDEAPPGEYTERMTRMYVRARKASEG